MINFAELKLKLCEFDENYIFKFSHQENKGTWTWQMILDGAIQQHTKDAKIISELLEIIKTQNNCITDIDSWLKRMSDLYWENPNYASRFKESVKNNYNILSETEQKLKQLSGGK